MNYKSILINKDIPKKILDEEQLSFGDNMDEYGINVNDNKINKCEENNFSYFIKDKANSTIPYDIKSIIRSQFSTTKNKEVYEYSNINSDDFVLIEIYRISQDTPSLYFFYLSLAWLTFPPYWTNDPGFLIQFKKKKDGEYQVQSEYYIKENYYQWVILLPFSFINLFTESAEDSVKVITNDYLSTNCLK